MLEIQAGGKYNVSLDESDTFCKLVLQFCVANGLGCLHHLPQRLLQPSHAPDYAACTQIKKEKI
jgi:hypothetical protein